MEVEKNKTFSRRSVQLSPTSIVEFTQRRKSTDLNVNHLWNEMMGIHDEIQRTSGPRVQEDMKEIALNIIDVIIAN